MKGEKEKEKYGINLGINSAKIQSLKKIQQIRFYKSSLFKKKRFYDYFCQTSSFVVDFVFVTHQVRILK